MKRMQIEKDIFKIVNELQHAYEKSKEIFEVVLDGRIEDCENNLDQLKVITEDEWKHVAQDHL